MAHFTPHFHGYHHTMYMMRTNMNTVTRLAMYHSHGASHPHGGSVVNGLGLDKSTPTPPKKKKVDWYMCFLNCMLAILLIITVLFGGILLYTICRDEGIFINKKTKKTTTTKCYTIGSTYEAEPTESKIQIVDDDLKIENTVPGASYVLVGKIVSDTEPQTTETTNS